MPYKKINRKSLQPKSPNRKKQKPSGKKVSTKKRKTYSFYYG